MGNTSSSDDDEDNNAVLPAYDYRARHGGAQRRSAPEWAQILDGDHTSDDAIQQADVSYSARFDGPTIINIVDGRQRNEQLLRELRDGVWALAGSIRLAVEASRSTPVAPSSSSEDSDLQRALSLSRAEATPSYTPEDEIAEVRHFGTATHLRPGFGFIRAPSVTEVRPRNTVFFHVSETNGVTLQRGDRVNFIVGRNSKGPCARSVALVARAARADRSSRSSRSTPDNETTTCVVCMDSQSDHKCIPCGHVVLCGSCARHPQLEPTCPVCREDIDRVDRV
jgi:cold shock CspA family protein